MILWNKHRAKVYPILYNYYWLVYRKCLLLNTIVGDGLLVVCYFVSNVLFKRISISIITNPWNILEQFNSFTLQNVSSPVSWIPSSVISGISISNTMINYHSPVSSFLSKRNWVHHLSFEIKKGDLIINIIFFYTLHYHYIRFFRSISTIKCRPSKNDRLKPSQISFIIHQSFILSNTIEWHKRNALSSNWMDMREGRFINSNVSYQ